MRISPPAVGLALAVTLLLSGCLPQQPNASPTPQPSSTPVFASEEEALAAAEAAYAEYLAVSDAIAADGGANAERIVPLITEERESEEMALFQSLATEGLHTAGLTTFDSMVLQDYVEEGGSKASLTTYVCLDVTNVRVLDASGADVTPSGRQNKLPLEVAFGAAAMSPIDIRVARSDSWGGDDFCAN